MVHSDINKSIVFTNGCFDILHAGHVHLLQVARGYGDYLIIGLNSDASVEKIKGKHRPITTQNDRRNILLALHCVDEVIIFDDLDPMKLITEIKPDVLVKGGDYKIDEIVGYDFITSKGGKVLTVPILEGRSTTSIIKKMEFEK